MRLSKTITIIWPHRLSVRTRDFHSLKSSSTLLEATTINNLNYQSMWKPGQTVTLNGKKYRIVKCSFEARYKTCYLCQKANTKTPCVDRMDYPDENSFSQAKCVENMPLSCYPKIEK